MNLNSKIQILDVFEMLAFRLAAETVGYSGQLHPPSPTASPKLGNDAEWSGLWSHVREMTFADLFAPAIATVFAVLTTMMMLQYSRGDPTPTPISAGLASSLLVFPSVSRVHFPGILEPAKVCLLWIAAGTLVLAGTDEMWDQIDDLRVSEHTFERFLALGIPLGMLSIAVPVLKVAVQMHTTGRNRIWSFPGWILLAVGFLGTFLMTGAVNSLIAALGCAAVGALSLTCLGSTAHSREPSSPDCEH